MPRSVIRGQFRGFTSEAGVAPGSTTETFAALRLDIHSPRWEGVPFYIRAGKNLPVTCTEILVRLRRGPTAYSNLATAPNHLRMRVSPTVQFAIGMLVMVDDEKMLGAVTELMGTRDPSLDEKDAYARVLTDAIEGDATLFARQDYVEEAWRIVDPVLKAGTPIHTYEAKTWGPSAVDQAGRTSRRLAQPQPGRVDREDGAVMRIEVLADADAVAQMASATIVEECRHAVRARGRFVAAISGGRTPWQMLRVLAEQDVPWEHVHVVQVDERVAPAGHADRNLTHLRESLERAPLDAGQIHAMPVDAPDLEAAAERYAAGLEEIAGLPPVLDIVHLGLGADGHTASLVPGDSVLDVTDADVALTGVYQGRRRMTLTYPILDRARRVLWVVTGSDKAGPLAKLLKGDVSIPAGRVRQDQALILADRAAAGSLEIPSMRR